MRFPIIITLLLALSLPLLAQSPEGLKSEAGEELLQGIRLKKSDLPAALAALNRAAAAKNFPLKEYALLEIGEAYYEAGQYPQAAEAYRKMIALFPTSLLVPRAKLMIGKSWLKAEKYPEAIKAFRALVDNFPDSPEAPEARFLIGRSFQEQKKWGEAYLAYEETDLHYPLTYFGQRARAGIAYLKKTYGKKLPVFFTSPQALFKKGLAYFDKGDYESATNIFRRLAWQYPKNKLVKEAWLMLGRAELQQNRFSTAISEFNRATEEDRALGGQANYYLGISYGQRGNYELAVAALRKVVEDYSDSKLAADAAYWLAYYQELSGKNNDALLGYYQLIKNYPYSQNVPEAIWRLGRLYYWSGDFQNAATYLHLGQLYPAGESSPRCYFFEAKALERLGNRSAALEVYKKLADRFDHSYYSHRARQKLKEYGLPELASSPFHEEDFSLVLKKIADGGLEELLAVMEIWEQTNQAQLQDPVNPAISQHLEKYRALSALGLASYAAAEARYAVELASGVEAECSQTKMGEMLIRSGEYRQPIAFAHRKVREAVIHGKQKTLPKKTWQIAYPRGYWKEVAEKSRFFGLDPYLVLAVIREESRFNHKAVSSSNARGLMQIMPKTGQSIAKDLKIKSYRLSRLFDPPTNIEMGSYYLSSLIKRFDNNFYLALAGYNGGPNRISRYLSSWYNGNLGLVDIDEFVESLPVRETRLYVQKVMESYFEYKRIYDRKGS